MFKQFIEILPDIYMKNFHTHPQKKIISDHKLNIDIYIDIDNPRDIELLKKKLDVNIPKNNVSCKKDKNTLLDFLKNNEYYSNIIHNIYKNDDDFKKNIKSNSYI